MPNKRSLQTKTSNLILSVNIQLSILLCVQLYVYDCTKIIAAICRSLNSL